MDSLTDQITPEDTNFVELALTVVAMSASLSRLKGLTRLFCHLRHKQLRINDYLQLNLELPPHMSLSFNERPSL